MPFGSTVLPFANVAVSKAEQKGGLLRPEPVAEVFVRHRRSSAVWFFRVGLMAWVFLTGGIGVDFETFTGPFIFTLGFAQYLLPLAVLEWYFHLQDRPRKNGQLLFAGTLAALTLFMGIGIFAATAGLWLPRI